MTNTVLPQWVQGQGPCADIVISSRARLARCLDGFPFPHRASNLQLIAVAEKVCNSVGGLASFDLLRIDRLSIEHRSSLVDANIISPEFARGGAGRILLLDCHRNLSIMINEEDHLRIQILDSGLSIDRIWDNINRLDDEFSNRLPYAFSDRIGFLTCSLSNLGTGLRLSVMMHLASLSRSAGVAEHIKAASHLGVSVRGVHGEGTRPLGDLFQVSNRHTLGMAEVELVDKVNSVATYLFEAERAARKEFMQSKANTLLDELRSALNRLMHSHRIAAEQALALLSTVRLGFEEGLVRGCRRQDLNLLLTKMMSLYKTDFDAEVARAGLLRKYLGGVSVDI